MAVTNKVTPRKEIMGMGSYVLGKSMDDLQKELGLEKIRKMAENENPFGCSPLAKKAMISELEYASLYPEGLAPQLATKLANYLKITPDELIFGNGSDEIIRLLTRAFVSHGDEVVMADVTFPRYKTNVLIEGGNPVIVPLKDGVHNLDGLLEAITDKTKMVFVCNPNNPTGTIVGREELLEFIESIPAHILVVIDEAYYEYVTTQDYLETLPLLSDHPNLVVLRTFSKLYGLAALRIGYGAMHPDIVMELRKVKDVFNANRIAQVAALASIDDETFVDECIKKNEEGRLYLESAFEEMGLTYFPSQANFIMVHFPCDGDEIYESLLKEGIIVRSGSLLGYPQTVRVTIGSKEDNESFIAAVKKALNK